MLLHILMLCDVPIGGNGTEMIIHTNKTHVIDCDGWEHKSYRRYTNELDSTWKCSCGQTRVKRSENAIAEPYYKDTYGGKWTGD